MEAILKRKKIRSAAMLGKVAILIAVLFVWMLSALPARAEDKPGSLTLICESGGVKLSGMGFRVYHALSYGEDGALTLEEAFADCPVSLDLTDTSDWQNLASTLEVYAMLDGYTPDASGVTDSEGKLTFSGLEPGIYLLSGETIVLGNNSYIPSAALVELKAGEDGSVSLETYPKCTVRPVHAGMEETFTVRKVWKDTPGGIALPISIEVDIYCDWEYRETVTLDSSNNWTYTWAGDSECKWRVKEREIPKPYTVIYEYNETQYLLENTYQQTETTTTTTATGTGTGTTETTSTIVTAGTVPSATPTGGGTTGKLPQTGQLKWPIPVLGAGGLLLFAFGLRLRARRKREEAQLNG